MLEGFSKLGLVVPNSKLNLHHFIDRNAGNEYIYSV